MGRKPISKARIREIQRVDGSIELRPSEQEMYERRVFVRSLHAMGMRADEIVDRAIRPQEGPDGKVEPARFDCKEDAIRRIISEIRTDLQRELEAIQPTLRASGLERLYGHLLRLNSELAQMRQAAKPDWSNIRQHAAEVLKVENQIAKMEGTLEPLKVEHRHTGDLNVNVQRVVSGMTDEQVEQAIREEREIEQARRRGSITTSGETIKLQADPTARPNVDGGRGLALPTARPADLVSGPRQTAGVDQSARKERSSDIAARRQILSPLDPDVEGRARQGGGGVRVVS